MFAAVDTVYCSWLLNINSIQLHKVSVALKIVSKATVANPPPPLLLTGRSPEQNQGGMDPPADGWLVTEEQKRGRQSRAEGQKEERNRELKYRVGCWHFPRLFHVRTCLFTVNVCQSQRATFSRLNCVSSCRWKMRRCACACSSCCCQQPLRPVTRHY